MITIALIERLGRKWTLTLEFTMLGLSLCLLFHCTSSRILVTIILFLIRGIASGVFQVRIKRPSIFQQFSNNKTTILISYQAAYVYTPEVYPTILRSVGVGSCSGMARFGAMLTPYIAQVLMKSSLATAVSVYVGTAFIAAFVSYRLPLETKGQEMKDLRSRHR